MIINFPELSVQEDPCELPEGICELPEGSGLSWIRSDFLGVGGVELFFKGEKVGRLIEVSYNDGVLWMACDHRKTLENGNDLQHISRSPEIVKRLKNGEKVTYKDFGNSIVKVGNKFQASLKEASRALVNAILQ